MHNDICQCGLRTLGESSFGIDMNSNPVISVITVCYNSASTIQRAIESVVSQDWPNIQHIVIDGGSNDGTKEVLEKFSEHLSCTISEPDNGLYDAMNKGIAHATGDIICFLNSDDFYASNTILTGVVQTMREHAVDAVLGDVSFFHHGRPNVSVRRYRSDRFSPKKLPYGWMPAHPAMFLKKQMFDRVGKFRTDFKIAADFDFVLRLFLGHDVKYKHVPTVMVKMQTGGASTSGIRSKIRLNQEVLRSCRDNGVNSNWVKVLSKYPLKLMEAIFTN